MQKHAVWPYCALTVACVLAGLAGCNQPALPAPAVLSKFEAHIDGGFLTHDIVLTNRNPRSLKRIDLTVTVYFETDVKTLTRYWGYWKQDESQTVNVASSGRIQRISISGTAVAIDDDEQVQLSAVWLAEYEQAK